MRNATRDVVADDQRVKKVGSFVAVSGAATLERIVKDLKADQDSPERHQ